jgi:DNA-3-methyladenine glycosylase
VSRNEIASEGSLLSSQLPREFFARDVLEVAPDCLGLELVTHTSAGCARGRIVEVEAYRGPEDRAAHSFGGRRTARTEAMFGPAGHAYVFLIYGIHSHINIVTGQIGNPQAVLIRALEPLDGLPLMQERRAGSLGAPLAPRHLCNGPGKLCRALGIDRRFNGVDLLAPSGQHQDYVSLISGSPVQHIATSRRIGVDYAGEWADRPWRFFDAESPYVSRLPKRGSSSAHG